MSRPLFMVRLAVWTLPVEDPLRVESSELRVQDALLVPDSQLSTLNSQRSLKQRSVSGRRDYSQVAIGGGGSHPSARRSLQEACLDQVRLVEVLESAAVFSHRGGDRS